MDVPPFELADLALLILYPLIALTLGWLLAKAATVFFERGADREAELAQSSVFSQRSVAPREVRLFSDLTVS